MSSTRRFVKLKTILDTDANMEYIGQNYSREDIMVNAAVSMCMGMSMTCLLPHAKVRVR